MPAQAYTVTVRTRADGSNEALAEAGQYLAYADQTDSFGYLGKILDTESRLEDGQWYIAITFETIISSVEEKAAFKRELETLSRVEGFGETTHLRI